MLAPLRRAMERGAVMCGGSAGAICWFDGGHSDSFDPDTFRGPMLAGAVDGGAEAAGGADGGEKKPWEYIRVSGLGWLPGLVCPHHDRTQSNGVPRAADFDAMPRDAALAAVVPRLALAAAHARARALPDRLRRVDGERAAARVDHLRLGHLLALAHDVRLRRDAERVDLVLSSGVYTSAVVALLGHDDRRALRVEGRVGRRVEAGLLQQLDRLERDRGRAGDARRVDAGRVDEPSARPRRSSAR